ncbi:MAG TPA: zf-HC2 domain-containing protein [Mycobacteriales bacterium]|jgi:anti-sigma factor RsiW|nr:zf-HC2 domain-containing protein [Mycobacteriales bacterium]
MICSDATIALGAYVLGTLDGHERSEVDAHLRGCVDCRAALDELAALPALLERLSLQDLGEAIPLADAPEELFAKVAAQARAEHDRSESAAPVSAVVLPFHRRRRVQLASAAAAVVLIAGATTTVALVGSSGPDRPGVQVVAGAQGPVHMRVALSSQTAGTALRVSVSGLPKDERCRLVAIADDGTRDYVGRWYATYSGDAQVTGSTSIATGQLAQLVLLGTDGKKLVSVPI